MTFPHINVKTKNFEAPVALTDFLEKRMATLEKLLPKGDVVCDVELEKTTEHHAGNIYRTEINIAFASKVLRAEAAEETMEAAIDSARNYMKRELEKSRSRSESLFRRGARKAKELFRFRE
ncbi:ribosome-associated translation inhibitor RaiA [Patescibacteria group bacterium]|nr:ribosome-associated translation inhibitor RaiA [Patescibacteria group bacterium]